MTSRREMARQRREAIMSSKRFRTWWGARKHESPTPSDPYRAFMIDIGLRAKKTDKPTWEQEPNRRDLEQVDDPVFSLSPSPKPSVGPRGNRGRNRRPTRGTSIPAGPPPIRPYDPYTDRGLKEPEIHTKVKQDVEGMSAFFHVVAPRTFPQKGTELSGGGGGVYHSGGKAPSIEVATGSAILGPKGRGWQARATARHEAGHHIHYQLEKPLLGEKRSIDPVNLIARARGQKTEVLRMESVAWDLGRRYTKAQIAKGLEPKHRLGQFSWYGRSKYDTYLQYFKRHSRLGH